MGILEKFLNGRSDNRQSVDPQHENVQSTNEYRSVSRLDIDSKDQNNDSDKKVQCIKIDQQTDIIQTKDELRGGNIVLADISDLGTGLSEDRVLSELKQAVTDVSGDIAMQNTDTHVILTPNNISVSRTVL